MNSSQGDRADSDHAAWKLAAFVAAAVLLGAVALVTLSAARMRSPVWNLDLRTSLLFGLIATMHVVVVATLALRAWRGRPASTLHVLLAVCASTALLFGAVLFLEPRFPRTPLVAAPVLAASLAWATVVLRRWRGLRLAAIAVLALAGIGLQLSLANRSFQQTASPQRVVREIGTALYRLRATEFRNYIPRPDTNQGGITRFADGYLLATGDGDVHVYRRSRDGTGMSVERIPTRVPINRAQFIAAAAGTDINLAYFRVADVLAQEQGESFRLFVTHHFWKDDQRCWVMRISTLEGRYEDFNARTRPERLRWRTLFESRPCVELATATRPPRFSGLFNGGRMVLVNEHELLLSTGDHAMEGFGYDVAASQDPEGSYGKILSIDLRDGSSTIYSLGHRNPEGLHLAPDGTLWETEHGPRGGDELNRIRRGANYGWPIATYGTEYGTLGWPLSLVPGSHDGFEQPFYSWYPSIGPSNLIEITSPLFPAWKGDLLVSSLAGQTLFRMRIRDNRVVHTEQIPIGERIRDVLEGHGGEIVLWTDRESMIFLEPSEDTGSGEALYEACAACHVAHGDTPSVGPSLKGIHGRRIASLPGYEYSEALRRLGGTWTRQRLDAFLKDPAGFAPGTTMMFGGIADPRGRTSLVDYLVAPDSRLDVAPPPTGID